MEVYVEVVGDLAIDLVQERDEVRSGVYLRRSVMTLPVGQVQADQVADLLDQVRIGLGVCQPRQEAALRPATANCLGAQSRPVEHRQADDAVARGAAITKCRYRRRDSDPLR